MKEEIRNCQNCKNDFTIEIEDFKFYEKIKVPPPTWCPECRQKRRYAWRNERTLYRRDCDLCKKNIVTVYSKNKPHKVYCLKCWWGDAWDPASYGRDFDFSRSFFDQYRDLQLEVPRMALFSKNNINSDYTNHSADDKNTYMSFCCFNNEDVLYSTWIFKSKNCIDCSYIHKNGEKLYEMVDSKKSYQCQYGVLLENCINCYYSYDLRNCSDCFLSSNLRNKKYVFKNKQYTKEEYLEKINDFDLGSFNVREKLNKEFTFLFENNFIHRYVVSEMNINSTGNMLFSSRNASVCFDADFIEDSKYIYSAISPKSSMDLYHIGWDTELAYENHGGRGYFDSKFCHISDNAFKLSYCDSCQDCKNLFGCISVKKGEYMILNKKYSKEEYLELTEKIIEYMKKTKEYGEFFPPSISPVCYNETQGNYYMPMTKEEALNSGWQWEDSVPGIFGKETIKTEDILDTIDLLEEDVLSEIFRCIECDKNYNIVPNEFVFYKKEKIPLPRRCPECRYKRRFALRLPRRLWHRKCMKEGCTNEFETSYAPSRPEIVYCERCYQQEVY